MACSGEPLAFRIRPEFSLITNVANNIKSTQLTHTTQSYWRGSFQESIVAGVVRLHCMAEQVYWTRERLRGSIQRWGWEEFRTIKQSVPLPTQVKTTTLEGITKSPIKPTQSSSLSSSTGNNSICTSKECHIARHLPFHLRWVRTHEEQRKASRILVKAGLPSFYLYSFSP